MSARAALVCRVVDCCAGPSRIAQCRVEKNLLFGRTV